MKKVIYKCGKCNNTAVGQQMAPSMPCKKCNDKMTAVKVANKNVGK